jgi:[protein-PII] uridylyltransferase
MTRPDDAPVGGGKAFARHDDRTLYHHDPARADREGHAALPIRHALRILAVQGAAPEAVAQARPALAEARRRVVQRYLENGAVDALKLGLARIADGLVVGLIELARQSRADLAETMMPPLAVVAIGEHGGRWLAPASPLDLVFVLPGRHDYGGRARAMAEFVVRALAQLGWAAHALIDTPLRSLEQAAAQPHLLERLLDARLVWGSDPLFATLTDGLPRRPHDPGGATVRGLLAAQLAASLGREGRISYFEPDLKHGTGALADLRRLDLLAALESDDWRAAGSMWAFGARAEAWRFLSRARSHLHIVDGSAEDRLVADAQAPVAMRLGLSEGSEAGARRLRDECEAHRNQVRAIITDLVSRTAM